MTFKDAFKLVNDYNNAAKIIGKEPVALYFRDMGEKIDATSYEEFEEAINDIYFEDCAKAILESEIKINDDFVIGWKSRDYERTYFVTVSVYIS